MEIQLKYNNEKVNMLIDDDDFEYLKLFCTNPIEAKFTTNSKTAYAITRKTIDNKRKQFYIHRIIMGVLNNPNLHIDHINKNTLDNRKKNLRIVTRSQNMKNRKSSFSSTSDYLGVYFCSYKKGKSKWRSVIKPNDKKNIHLGYYENQDDAGYAYNLSAEIIHGEYANLNKINEKNISNKIVIQEKIGNYLSKQNI